MKAKNKNKNKTMPYKSQSSCLANETEQEKPYVKGLIQNAIKWLFKMTITHSSYQTYFNGRNRCWNCGSKSRKRNYFKTTWSTERLGSSVENDSIASVLYTYGVAISWRIFIDKLGYFTTSGPVTQGRTQVPGSGRRRRVSREGPRGPPAIRRDAVKSRRSIVGCDAF